MIDLSGIMHSGKMDPWYEMRMSTMTEMQDGQRSAHISSMKHSQKHDYKSDLRLVLDDKEGFKGGDPFDMANYALPGMEQAKQACVEVVIRHGGREFVAKNDKGPTGFRVDGQIVADTGASGAAAALNTKRPPLDL